MAGPQPAGEFRVADAAAATAMTAVGSARSGSEPPPTNASSSRACGRHAGEPPKPLRPTPRTAAAIPPAASRASAAAAPRSVPWSSSRYSRSVASRAASVILSSRKARISGSRLDPLDQLLPAGDDAGLRAAEQLVAAEQDQVGPGPRCSRRRAARRAGRSGRSRPAPRCRCRPPPGCRAGGRGRPARPAATTSVNPWMR